MTYADWLKTHPAAAHHRTALRAVRRAVPDELGTVKAVCIGQINADAFRLWKGKKWA